MVGIFPGRDAIIRLVGVVLAGQNDEWTESRRYTGLENTLRLPQSRARKSNSVMQDKTTGAGLTIGQFLLK